MRIKRTIDSTFEHVESKNKIFVFYESIGGVILFKYVDDESNDKYKMSLSKFVNNYRKI